MAFNPVTKRILKQSPELRKQFFAELKKEQHPRQIAEATESAKRFVQSIEQQETRILGSDAYRQAFNETVKPEMRPLQPTSDLYEKGYMQEEAFWNDRHNRVAYSYGQNARMKGILRSLCDGDGTRALIESRRAEARALSESVPKEELKIHVPIAFSDKAIKEAQKISDETGKKAFIVPETVQKSLTKTDKKAAFEEFDPYAKEFVRSDKNAADKAFKPMTESEIAEMNQLADKLKAEHKLGNCSFKDGTYFEDGKAVSKTDPRCQIIKKYLDLGIFSKEFI